MTGFYQSTFDSTSFLPPEKNLDLPRSFMWKNPFSLAVISTRNVIMLRRVYTITNCAGERRCPSLLMHFTRPQKQHGSAASSMDNASARNWPIRMTGAPLLSKQSKAGYCNHLLIDRLYFCRKYFLVPILNVCLFVRQHLNIKVFFLFSLNSPDNVLYHLKNNISISSLWTYLHTLMKTC